MTRRVLLTRAPSVSRELTGLLRGRGYQVSTAPLLEAQWPDDTAGLREILALATAPRVPTWLAVTSANTVAALARVAGDPHWGRRLEAARAGSPGLRVAAVGAATARSLRDAGVGVDFTPRDEQSAAGMLAQWPEPHPQQCSVALLPASELASPLLARGLGELGYRTLQATAYRMVPAPAPDPLLPERTLPGDPPVLSAHVARHHCAHGRFHAVVATAPSRVGALLDGAPVADSPSAPNAALAMTSTAWVAMGEPTARALRQRGIVPTVAGDPSPTALAEAVDRALTEVMDHDPAAGPPTATSIRLTHSTQENTP